MASQSAAQTVSPNGGEQWSGPEYSSAGSYSELPSSLLAQRTFVVLPDQSPSPELFRSAPHGVCHLLHGLYSTRRLSWRQATQLTHSRIRDKIRPAWMSIGTHRGDVPLEAFNHFQESSVGKSSHMERGIQRLVRSMCPPADMSRQRSLLHHSSDD